MEGVFTAIITPFDKNETIDQEAFLKLVTMQERAKIQGLVIAGTTGEGWALSNDEIEVLYTLARRNFSGKIVIGTGAISTKKTIENTLHAKKLGADAALVVVPYYNLPSEEGVVNHYKSVVAVGLPVIVYHHPGRTGVCLSIECLERIVDIKGVVGLKETVGDMEYFRRLSKRTTVFSGCDDKMKEAKAFGAKGVISVISNLYPSETSRFFASNEKDSIWILGNLLTLIFKEGNPAGIKRALFKKKYSSDYMRAPLSGLSSSGIQDLEKLMDEMLFKEIANK